MNKNTHKALSGILEVEAKNNTDNFLAEHFEQSFSGYYDQLKANYLQ